MKYLYILTNLVTGKIDYELRDQLMDSKESDKLGKNKTLMDFVELKTEVNNKDRRYEIHKGKIPEIYLKPRKLEMVLEEPSKKIAGEDITK